MLKESGLLPGYQLLHPQPALGPATSFIIAPHLDPTHLLALGQDQV